MESKEMLELSKLTTETPLNGLLTSAQLASINPYLGLAHAGYTLTKSFMKYNENRHHEIKGGITSSNFTQLNRKPYGIMLVTPESNDEHILAKYFNFWGCPSRRTDVLNINNCMYENHAFIKGNLHYKKELPLYAFNKLNAIFNKGVHIIND